MRDIAEIVYNWERYCEYLVCGSWKILKIWVGDNDIEKSTTILPFVKNISIKLLV